MVFDNEHNDNNIKELHHPKAEAGNSHFEFIKLLKQHEPLTHENHTAAAATRIDKKTKFYLISGATAVGGILLAVGALRFCARFPEELISFGLDPGPIVNAAETPANILTNADIELASAW